MPTSTKSLDRHLRKDSKSGVYKAAFKDRTGTTRERTTGTRNKDKARAVLAQSRLVEIEAAAKANVLTAEALTAIMAGRKVTGEMAVTEWAAWRAGFTSANTIRTQEITLRKFLREFALEKRPVSAIAFEQCNAFVNAPDAGKVSNREQRLAALKSLFHFLTARAYYVGNPTKLVNVRYSAMTHEQKERTPRVPFTAREVDHIVGNTTGFWRWATALSYWAGFRLSDICCLEWASILPKEIVVWTRKADARVALPLSHPLIGGGKLAVFLMEMMAEHNVHPRYVFPEQAAIVADPALRSKLSVYYSRILERLGIEGKSFHCLRHGFATRLDEAGTTIEEIGRMLGHSPSSGEVTKGYIHRKK